ncbi:hypothetical protein QZH41_016486 [Actinostola sp. cb2023]|nr:hypothetical protein QZH41_016486 [Actinostola sp. cb2023]
MDIGPSLPPHLLKQKREESENSTQDEIKAEIGPGLPPSLSQVKTSKCDFNGDDDDAYGPALPPHLTKAAKSRGPIGPALPGATERLRNESDKVRNDESSDEETDHVIGPMPSSSSVSII